MEHDLYRKAEIVELSFEREKLTDQGLSPAWQRQSREREQRVVKIEFIKPKSIAILSYKLSLCRFEICYIKYYRKKLSLQNCKSISLRFFLFLLCRLDQGPGISLCSLLRPSLLGRGLFLVSWH